MKILLVHNLYRYRGGEESYFFSLQKLLKKNGHKVITYTKDNRDIRDNLVGKIKIALNLFYNKKVEDELSTLLQKHKPDIAHFNNIYPLITPTAYRICKNFNIPIIQTVHNFRLICPGSLMFKNGKKCPHNRNEINLLNILFHNCYRNSYIQSFAFSASILFHKVTKNFDNIDIYLFPSSFTLKTYEKVLNLPKKKMIILPYFLDYKNKVIAPKSASDYFLFVGRFASEKGIIPLLKIFSKLPKLKLIIIGDGPLRQEINKYDKYKNIDILQFLPQRRILEYMKNALYTIIPSYWYETGPIVMLESFAVGTPVIVPRIGVFKDIIDPSKGLFFKFNDYNDLKLKVLSAVKNGRRIYNNQNIIKKFYNTHYTAIIHYKSLLKIYTHLNKL